MLLKNPAEQKYKMINDHLTKLDGTFTRVHMEHLKSLLKWIDVAEPKTVSAWTTDNIPEENTRDIESVFEFISNSKTDKIENEIIKSITSPVTEQPRRRVHFEKDEENSSLEDVKVLVSLPKIFDIINEMVSEPSKAEAIINQIKNEVFNYAN